MKNGVVTILVVLFIGVSLILSTALFQYSKKYEAVKSNLDKVEGQVDELKEQSGFVLSNKLEERVDLHTARISRLEKHNRKMKKQATVGGQNSEELARFTKRIDSLGAELTRLEKELDSLKKVKPQQLLTGDLLNSDLFKDLEKSVDSLEKLLTPSYPKKIRGKVVEQRVKKAKEKSLKQNKKLIQVTVDQLYKAYEDNDVAAKHKYGSDFVLLRGKVNRVNEFIYLTVTLESKNGWNSITCFFDKGKAETLLGIKKGEMVTIKGKYKGSADFKECTLVK